MSAAGATLTLVVDARPLLEGLEAALVAVEPTPIWDELWAEYGAGLTSAKLAALEAQASVEEAMGTTP